MSWDQGLHEDGTPWHKAPVPRRWHRCWPQSIYLVDVPPVRRCACGGISTDRGRTWQGRNRRGPRRRWAFRR